MCLGPHALCILIAALFKREVLLCDVIPLLKCLISALLLD